MTTSLDQLRVALERLASAPAVQAKYLVQLGVSPLADELALELDDVLPVVMASLSPAAASAVVAVDQALDSMSGEDRANLWTVDALQSSPEWDQVRHLARVALEQLATKSET